MIHVLYLSDLIICNSFHSQYRQHIRFQKAYSEPASAAVLRFCKHELMQAIRLLLLDDEFVQAYVHGFLVKCGDGVLCRVFPRILVYSADYPEKY